jgi:hypothetical protein
VALRQQVPINPGMQDRCKIVVAVPALLLVIVVAVIQALIAHKTYFTAMNSFGHQLSPR